MFLPPGQPASALGGQDDANELPKSQDRQGHHDRTARSLHRIVSRPDRRRRRASLADLVASVTLLWLFRAAFATHMHQAPCRIVDQETLEPRGPRLLALRTYCIYCTFRAGAGIEDCWGGQGRLARSAQEHPLSALGKRAWGRTNSLGIRDCGCPCSRFRPAQRLGRQPSGVVGCPIVAHAERPVRSLVRPFDSSLAARCTIHTICTICGPPVVYESRSHGVRQEMAMRHGSRRLRGSAKGKGQRVGTAE